jgi:hypothetical protein
LRVKSLSNDTYPKRNWYEVVAYSVIGLFILAISPFFERSSTLTAQAVLGVPFSDVVFEVLVGIGIGFLVVGVAEAVVLYDHHVKIARIVGDSFGQIMKQVESKSLVLDWRVDEDYLEAWAGYQGTYFAYNPDIVLDDMVTRAQKISFMDQVYVPRFTHPEFNGFYLFFTGSDGGVGQMRLFKQMLTEARKKEKIDLQRFHIRTVNLERPEVVFDIGSKGGVEFGLLNFTGPYAITTGLYNYVFKIHESKVIQDLKAEFSRAWASGADVSVQQFLDGP